MTFGLVVIAPVGILLLAPHGLAVYDCCTLAGALYAGAGGYQRQVPNGPFFGLGRVSNHEA